MPTARTLALLLASLVCVAPAARAEDPLPLDASTRDFDQLHLGLDVELDMESGRIQGAAVHRLRSLADGLQVVRMHLEDMEITSVTCDGAPLQVAQPKDGVVAFTLDRARKQDEEFELRVGYGGVPQAGLWFFRPSEQHPGIPYQVWSQGQGTENRHWFPCYDLPDDRLESRLRVTVPKRFMTLSNGVPARREELSDDRVAHTWELDRPHPTYLITLVVGEFEDIVSDAAGVEHHDVVPPGWGEWVPESFGRVPDMMEFLQTYTGQPYAWPRHSQVTVWDFMWGGMENTGATTLNMRALHKEGVRPDYSADGLVAHELSHQWFGDLVTCRTWNHIWLNEGFATYFTDLWREQYEDEDAFRAARLRSKESYMDASDLVALSIAPRPDRATDCADVQKHPYTKGSSVLHMLRNLLGAEVFRRGVRRYVADNKDRSVESEALRRALEQESGAELGWFFDQWVYASGFPELDVRSEWKPSPRDGEPGTLHLHVRQTQPATEHMAAFRTPVEVVVAWPGGRLEKRRHELYRPVHEWVIPGPGKPEQVLLDPQDWLLARVTEHKPRAAWIRQLREARFVIPRIRAARELSGLGPKAVAALADAATADARHEVRAAACTSLGKLGGRPAADALLRAAEDADSRVRRAALEALGSIPAAWSAKALARHAREDPSGYAAAAAAVSLGKTRAPGAAEVLRQVLQRESHRDEIRRRAVEGLAQNGDVRSAQLVLEYTDYHWGKGRQHRLRHAALDALVLLDPHGPNTAERVVELIEDPYFRMKQWAAAHAAALGLEAAIPALERMEKRGRGPGVRAAMRRALVKLRGEVEPSDAEPRGDDGK